ncbi:MAG: pyridoxal phosphate-dependent aminotransferase [Planctomycetes bacterium]|nr:pyridoxal phosphate-dependent aminotransferase [Planctomycetota bacterium]
MSEIPLSARARAITDSITLAITARAQTMKAQGVDVVSLAAGEPDFASPDAVREAGIKAIRDGQTRYTAATGMPDVRAAGASWLSRVFGLNYAAGDVIVTAGAKPALMLGLMAICGDGDRVLLPAPFWPSYVDIVKLALGVPVIVPAVPEQDFVHAGAQIVRAARDAKAKGIVLNYPNNPSGAVPTRAQVEELVAAALEAGLWIVSDEIYARLIYDGREHFSPARCSGAAERVLVVNGGTKSHSMTGWRIGFLAGPRHVVDAAGRIQSQAIGNACTISQRAVLAVCNESDDAELRARLRAFDERRRWVVQAVNQIPGLTLATPHGAFYALIDARPVCRRLGYDDVELAERLLSDAKVALIPGGPFAIPGFIRLSYAASMKELEEGVRRIAAFLS